MSTFAEYLIAVALVILLGLLADPFMLWMPTPTQMVIVLVAAILAGQVAFDGVVGAGAAVARIPFLVFIFLPVVPFAAVPLSAARRRGPGRQIQRT